MARACFSRSAKADLISIAVYTRQTWGVAQAERYLDDLEECSHLLAGNPSLGRPCEWIRPGLRRFERHKHLLFYRQQEDGILVVRILHQSMMPNRQPFGDADQNA